MTKRRKKNNSNNSPATKSTKPEMRWLVTFICVHFLLAFIYWHYTPYGASPDEGPHGKYVETLVQTKRLPIFDMSDRQNYETHQPPLYYLLAVPFFMVGRVADVDNPASMVRLLSVFLGLFSILLIYGAVRSAFPEEKQLALTSMGFAALLPTHLMLSSSVSNDILLEVVFGLALLLIARMLFDGPNLKLSAVLGVILGIGLLTKMTCIILFPIAGLAYLLIWRRNLLSARAALGHISLLLGISLVVGGWWIIRNQNLYGDPLAMAQFERVFQDTPKPEYWLNHGWSWTMYFGLVTAWTFASFWGVFGHMNVFMPTWIYFALAGISLAAIVVIPRGIIEVKVKSNQSYNVLLIYGITLLLVLLVFLKFNLTFFQAQGRYLYPALIPISVLWVLGIRKLFPEHIRCIGTYAAIAIPLLVQIAAITKLSSL